MKEKKKRLAVFMTIYMVITLLTSIFNTGSVTVSATETQPRTLKVLAIGNSFSVDAMRYLYQLAQDCGATNIVLGNLYIGGCDLKTHWKNASGNLPAYTYYKNTTGDWKFSNDKTMLFGIQDEQWDVITLQQASDDSGRASTYNSDLTNLANYVVANKTNPNAKLAWHMTWAWRGDSVTSTYNYDQLTMYNSIVNAVQTKVLTNPSFDFVIPAGTAIQNGRSSFIGDNFNYDSRHLSRPYGRYVAGMLWLKSITGWSIDNITYIPTADVTPDYLAVAKESVNCAVANPYQVTVSTYIPTSTALPTSTAAPTDTATPTSTVIPTATPASMPNVLDLNLTNYADVNAAVNDGWTFDDQSVVSVSTTTGLQVGNGSIGTDGYKSFDPIVIRGDVGTHCSLGANAKAIFVVKQVNLNGLNTLPYISLQGTDNINGTNNIVAVCRKGSNSFYYGTTGSTPQPEINGTATTLATSGLNDYKFEILISDASGNYLAKPIVNAYVSSGGTGAYAIKVDTGDVLSGVIQIDKIKVHSQTSSSAKAALKGCSLEVSADVDKVELNRVLFTANSTYDIASENIGNNAGQFSQTVVSALYAAIQSGLSVYNNPSASQVAVDNAVIELSNAIDACVPNTATPVPATQTPTPIPTTIVTTLLNDDFNGYADITAMQVTGWTINFSSTTVPTPATPVLATTAAPEYNQYFKSYANTYVSRTFTPVALTAEGGISPGKNAKLVITYDAYIGSATGSAQSYIKVDNSSLANNIAVSVGRRGTATPIRYSKSIGSPYTGLTLGDPWAIFKKLKFVIKITDETGAFLSTGPKVDVYLDDMNTPVTGFVDINMIDSSASVVDRFYMGGLESVIDIDNLNIALQADI